MGEELREKVRERNAEAARSVKEKDGDGGCCGTGRQPVGSSPRRGTILVSRGVEQRCLSRAEAPRRVLFLCTHNSARSQMAEGLLRHLAGDRFEVYSVGTQATSVMPEVIAAMAELGVDISGQESETFDSYLDKPCDYVVTVCDEANEACPFFPGAKNRLHWSLGDPSRATGDEEQRLGAFREVRDELLARIEKEFVPAGRESLTS